MNTGLGFFKSLIIRLVENKKLRNRIFLAAVILFVLQLYFVQELIAAELLFALAFVALFLLGSLFYALGAIGERSFDLTEVGIRVLANSARRGYAAVEEISRKSLRHPKLPLA